MWLIAIALRYTRCAPSYFCGILQRIPSHLSVEKYSDGHACNGILMPPWRVRWFLQDARLFSTCLSVLAARVTLYSIDKDSIRSEMHSWFNFAPERCLKQCFKLSVDVLSLYTRSSDEIYFTIGETLPTVSLPASKEPLQWRKCLDVAGSGHRWRESSLGCVKL